MGKVTDENRRELEKALFFEDADLKGMVGNQFPSTLGRLIKQKHISVLTIVENTKDFALNKRKKLQSLRLTVTSPLSQSHIDYYIHRLRSDMLMLVARMIGYLIVTAYDEISIRQNWTTLVFWAAIYGYCLVALWRLGIIQTLPVYGGFAVCVTVFRFFYPAKATKSHYPRGNGSDYYIKF